MLKLSKKRIIKTAVSVTALVLVVVMLLLLSRCSTEIQRLPKYRGLNSYPSVDEETVAENDNLAILWDNDEKQIYLFDKATGAKWGPRAIETEIDGGMTVTKKIPKVFSPIYVSYYDTNSCVVVEDLFAKSASIDMEAVAAKKIKNGIVVRYDFPDEKISVSVEYKLKKNSMQVSVDKKAITESSDKIVTSVSVAPFMCSVYEKDTDSYLFVPSGSGALIYPEAIVKKLVMTSEKVYGEDASINKDFEFYTCEAVRIPVYGTKVGNKGLCAIVTEDAEKSEIVTVSQDVNTGMSTVYAKTYLRGYDIIDLPKGFGAGGQTKLVSDPVSDSVFSIEFYPFGGEDCSYVDMANIYRDYLYSSNKCELEKTSSETAVNIQILGGAQVTKHFLGIPYTGILALTSVDQSKEIMESVAGIIGDNFIVNLSGFTESGVDLGKPAGNGRIAENLGSSSQLKKLLDSASKLGISAFVDFDTVRFNRSGLGCSVGDAAQRVDKKRISLTYKKKVSGMSDETVKSYRLVGRDDLDMVNEKLISIVKKYDLNTVALSTLTSMCYSDYSSKKYYICGGIEAQVINILKSYSYNNISTLGNSANAYAALYCSHITGAPLSSTDSDSFAYTIPFYEIVFKGYIPMSSKPVNKFYSQQIGLLKAAEAGIGVSYEIVGDYDTDLKYSVQNLSYVLTGDEMLKKLGEKDVVKFIEYFGKIKSASVEKHEILNEYVRRVIFDNGITVYVNYGYEPYEANGVRVDAMSFEYFQGGAEK